jgi:hypothetical protein
MADLSENPARTDSLCPLIDDTVTIRRNRHACGPPTLQLCTYAVLYE